jgi:hypothetical protein
VAELLALVQLLEKALIEPEERELAVATTVLGAALPEAVALGQPLLDIEKLERAEPLPAPLPVAQPEELKLEVTELLEEPELQALAEAVTAAALPVAQELPEEEPLTEPEPEPEEVTVTEPCTEVAPLLLALSEAD